MPIYSPPTITYCEENISSFIAQPANSWSNLIYIFIGLYLFWLSRNDKNSLLKIFPLLPILIGIFSFIYHASYTFLGQFLDLGSMFLLASFLIILSLKRLKNFSNKTLLLTFILINLASLLLVYFKKIIFGFNIGIPIFILQIFTVLILEFFLYRKNSYLVKNILIALLILLIAQVFWILDFFRIWCDPNTFHLINGHALWHIINGFCFIFIYRFYRQFYVK